MLEWIKAIFEQEPDAHTVPAAEATEFFADHRRDRLDTIQDREREIRDRVQDAFTVVDEALDDLESFQDADGYAVVDDVTDNIVSDRRRMIEQFSFPERPEQLYEELEAFIEEFGQVTQKEQAILDRIGEPARDAFSRLDAVKQAKQEVGAFLDTEHAVREQYESIREQVATLESLRSERDALQEERDDIALEPIKKRVSEAEDDLKAHREKDAWDEKEAVEDRITALESDRDEIISRVEKAAGKMERGLKKLLYQARNGEIDLSQETIDTLETVRDGDILRGLWDAEGAAAVQEAVTTAAAVMPDDLLGDRQQERFAEGADTFQQVPALQQEAADIQTDINELQEELDGFDLEEEEARLEQAVADAEDELQRRAQRRKELRQEIREHDQEIERTKEEIEERLNAALSADITVQ